MRRSLDDPNTVLSNLIWSDQSLLRALVRLKMHQMLLKKIVRVLLGSFMEGLWVLDGAQRAIVRRVS